MTRAPATALHRRIAAVGESFTRSLAYDSDVVLSLSNIAANQTTLDELCRRVDALESKFATLADQRFRQLCRWMIYNVHPETGEIIGDADIAMLLVDSGYKTVADVAKTQATKTLRPGQVFSNKIQAVYDKDRDKYGRSIDLAETEMLYEICLAAT